MLLNGSIYYYYHSMSSFPYEHEFPISPLNHNMMSIAKPAIPLSHNPMSQQQQQHQSTTRIATCPKCGRGFSELCEMLIHLGVEHESECPLCGKCFPMKPQLNLVEHIRAHFGLKSKLNQKNGKMKKIDDNQDGEDVIFVEEVIRKTTNEQINREVNDSNESLETVTDKSCKSKSKVINNSDKVEEVSQTEESNSESSDQTSETLSPSSLDSLQSLVATLDCNQQEKEQEQQTQGLDLRVNKNRLKDSSVTNSNKIDKLGDLNISNRSKASSIKNVLRDSIINKNKLNKESSVENNQKTDSSVTEKNVTEKFGADQNDPNRHWSMVIKKSKAIPKKLIIRFQCHQCRKAYRSLDILESHRKLKHDNLFTCHHCSKEFKKYTMLSRHIQARHRKQQQSSSSSSANDTKKCPHCSRSFLNQSSLMKHIRFHTGEMPLRCPHCSLGFLHDFLLARHIRKRHSVVESNRTESNILQKSKPSTGLNFSISAILS